MVAGRRAIGRVIAVVAAAVVALMVASSFAGAARADLVATVEVPSQAGSDLDLATFNIATRVRTNPGTNTSANEFHPSIAGHRLAFERIQGSFVRMIVRDVVTGQQAVVLGGAIVRGRPSPPSDPALAPNGNLLITGHVGSGTCPALGSTDLNAFPGGPFPQSFVAQANAGCVGGVTITTLEPLVLNTSPLDLLFARDCCGFPQAEAPNVPRSIGRFTGGQFVAGLALPFTCSGGNCVGESVQDPAMAPGGAVLVFEVVGLGGGQPPAGDPAPGLYSTPSTPVNGQFGPISALPPPVNGVAGVRETRPAFSADGRFLAFVRHNLQTGDERLFVWDSQTQLLLDSSGIDLGTLNGPLANLALSHGNVVLVNHPVVRRSNVSRRGRVSFTLASASDVGVLVQKVVGRTRVFGRPAPKLLLIGRIPLGHFRRGSGHATWDLSVDGRRLAPGLYQVTVRSVTPALGVRDLGHPVLIRVTRRH